MFILRGLKYKDLDFENNSYLNGRGCLYLFLELDCLEQPSYYNFDGIVQLPLHVNSKGRVTIIKRFGKIERSITKIKGKPIALDEYGKFNIRDPNPDFPWPFKYYLIVDHVKGCIPIIMKQIMNDFEKGKKRSYKEQNKILKFGQRDKKMPLFPIFGDDECFRLYILLKKRHGDEMATLSLEEQHKAKEKELKINI